MFLNVSAHNFSPQVCQGDVSNLDSLKNAVSGCENVVAAYGMSPPRCV